MDIMPMAIFGLGVPELLIILAVVLLLFGGSRLAGLGKSSGRALKEFKEETKGLKSEDKTDQPQVTGAQTPAPPQNPQVYQQPQTHLDPQSHLEPQSHVEPQLYQQPPATPSQNPDGSELRKDT